MKLPMGVLAPAIGQVLGLLLFPTITQAEAGGEGWSAFLLLTEEGQSILTEEGQTISIEGAV